MYNVDELNKWLYGEIDELIDTCYKNNNDDVYPGYGLNINNNEKGD